MADYGFKRLIRSAQELRCSLGHIAVTCAVETVSSHFVFLIILIWNSIEISLLRHGLMECGVEHGYHWSIWHQLLAGAYADEVCRIVKRRQIIAGFDGFMASSVISVEEVNASPP